MWSCQKICDTFLFLEQYIEIFGSKLCRQIGGILKETNCDRLAADLFFFCFEIEKLHVVSFYNNQVDVIDVLNSTSRHLDNLLNIDNSTYIEPM